jgi:hypothetical protein
MVAIVPQDRTALSRLNALILGLSAALLGALAWIARSHLGISPYHWIRMAAFACVGAALAYAIRAMVYWIKDTPG